MTGNWGGDRGWIEAPIVIDRFATVTAGDWSGTYSAGADGAYTFNVAGTDAFGNPAESESVTVFVDRTAPMLALGAPAAVVDPSVTPDADAVAAGYQTDIVVTVAALQLNGNKVYVLGQVTRPGEFVMTRTVDVMQAISTAGGTTPFAKLDEVRILRRGDQGTQIAIPFKYSDVQEGRKLEQNILL